MNLQTVKQANPEFFGEAIGSFFGDSDMEILTDTAGPVLRMTSRLGTRPVYSIDIESQSLSYLRHDPDVELDQCADPD